MSQLNEQRVGRLHGLWALTNRELKKWYKEPIILFMSIIQPAIWMGLFGKAMNIGAIFTNNPITLPPNLGLSPELQAQLEQALSNIPSKMLENTFGIADYFSYMSVGMISFVVLFTTMFSGMSIVWDRRLGFLNKVLSTPVSRGTIIFSKVLSATLRSIVQASIVIVFALLLGMQLSPTFGPLNILGVFAVIFLICLGLSSLFLLIAIRSSRWETQMAIVNLLNLPLMFTSNTLFATSMMPDWIQTIAKINPITYTTDAMRQLLLYNTDVMQLMIDFAYLSVFAVIFTSIGIVLSWRYLSK
ncbi:MAG: ABC transporter permease [Candidatus Bathyarchaeota archaeon]|nr:ABC transporter permease [Candidatus Bathyarchaeota archaeon]MDH5787627.1 ABC transporter permease [Candidatus Bathyarchaeota archaeon]